MLYSDFTTNDPNPVKRFLQRRRLADAVALIEDRAPKVILDFGAGNGDMCKALAARYPDSRIICYEPAEQWRIEAIGNLRGLRNVSVAATIDGIQAQSCDLVLCTEVFEHLPPATTQDAFGQIAHLLSNAGIGIIGVPLEIFLPALLKGVFRMTRRYGEFDATPAAVLRASLGFPPKDRPRHDGAFGLPYHGYHTGFDHRSFTVALAQHFTICSAAGSPVRWLGTWLNAEMYYVVRRKGAR